MNMEPYTIDMDAQLRPGHGYVASYVIGASDGSVVERRTIQQRFSAYSDALAHAYDAARARVSALRAEASSPNSGPDLVEAGCYVPTMSATRVVAS